MIRNILLIDNFDSFTFNLVEAFQRLDCRVRVVRNRIAAADATTLAIALDALIVISPGPGALRDRWPLWQARYRKTKTRVPGELHRHCAKNCCARAHR